jgi:hypothetical protein
MRRIIGQNQVTFGTGEDEITSSQGKIWDRTRSLFGTGEVDLWS